MKYYKSPTGEVFAFESDGSQDEWIGEDLILMTDEEVHIHLNPPLSAEEIKATSTNQLATLNTAAAAQIARIQDRIDTLGYGVDAGEATEEDEAELAALTISLKAWKAYKFALGKVTKQPTWPAAPVWPVEPAIPVIEADPETLPSEAM
jgi:hypothetical protein